MPSLMTSSASTQLYYQDVGQGPPVVLVHGWPLSHRMWEAQVNALAAAGHRCVAYDRRGFGQSGRPTSGYDYDTFASDLHDLMEHLDLRGVTLAGYSMGGGEVARYVARHGTARVARAMLVGAVTPFLLKTDDNPDGIDGSVFDGMMQSVDQDRVGFLAQFFPNFYNADPGTPAAASDLIAYSKSIAWAASPMGTRDCIAAFGRTDFREDLAKLTVPTLVVHGDADRIVPIDISARRALGLIPGSRLEVVQGAPHGFASTHAAELSRLMVGFVGS